MEAQRLHRGRLIDHLHLVVADLVACRRFYGAVLAVAGIKIHDGPDFFWADELFVSTADSAAAQGRLTGRIHLAFQAADRAMVDEMHRAGLAAGGTDNGAPGIRESYHPGYYAGFLLDPAGNNVEAVFHGPAARSAASVEIAFDA